MRTPTGIRIHLIYIYYHTLYNNISLFPVHICLDIKIYLVHQAGSRLVCRPCNMRGNDKLVAVLNCKKRIVLSNWLSGYYIKSCRCNHAFVKRLYKVCVINNRATSKIQKNCAALHLLKCLIIKQIFCIFVKRCMN